MGTQMMQIYNSHIYAILKKIYHNIIAHISQIDGALEAGKRIPLLDIGAGVYPTTLFFNHSCAPNTLRINQGTRVSKYSFI